MNWVALRGTVLPAETSRNDLLDNRALRMKGLDEKSNDSWLASLTGEARRGQKKGVATKEHKERKKERIC